MEIPAMSILGRFLAVLSLGIGMATAAAQGAEVPPAAQSAMAEGAHYEQQRQFPGAMDSYSRALKQAGGHCVPCLEALSHAQMKAGMYREAAGSAAQMAAQASDAKARSRAELAGAQALYALYFANSEGRGMEQNAKHASSALKDGEALAARAETDDPASERARMLHGRMLASLKRDPDAAREFEACASAPGVSPQECARAMHFAGNVQVARNEPAPEFELKTIEGKPVSLDSLAGKVVLIDFWATWCSVCKRDAGYVQSTADMFNKDRFVLLEVSADDSRGAWESYVRDHRMLGANVWDDQHVVADSFHVGGYPTYVILDGDGVERLRAVGIDGDLKGTIRKLIAEQPDAPRPAAGQ
jgi:thiol-disulfide isomerase/thioredoxin